MISLRDFPFREDGYQKMWRLAKDTKQKFLRESLKVKMTDGLLTLKVVPRDNRILGQKFLSFLQKNQFL